jgi:ABC-type glycerol-3-phosphate transport system substrate-binding protein
VVKWTWSTYWATLMASIGAGESPDVMNVGWGEVTQLGRPHGVKINQMLTQEMKEKWLPESWRSATYLDGSIYGVPTFDQ